MTDNIKRKRGKNQKKIHDKRNNGKEGSEGLGSTQGPDTLVVFVRNSKIMCIGAMLDPRFKTIEETAPEFTALMIDMNSVFEFEILSRWVPKETEAVYAVVTDSSTAVATYSSLTPSPSRLSGGISMSSFLTRSK
jgi:hypothetical protein